MKKSTKILAIVLAMLFLMSALAACGDSGDDKGADTKREESEKPSDTGDKKEEAPPTGDAAVADTRAEQVIFSANTDITNMNPWVSRNTSYNCVMPAVYEYLGAFDSFGGTFQGVLMESWEQVDDKTYEIKLYENIYDQAGNHMTADDVVFSFESCWAKGELAETAVVESVEATGEYTVQFHWPNTVGVGGFESVMSNVYVVTRASYEASADEMTTDPIGTGPYKVVDYVSGSSVTIEATDSYWQAEDKFVVPTQYSNVKTIKCLVISETSQVAMALQTDAIDISIDVGSEDLAKFDEGGQYADGFDVYSYPKTSGQSLMCNMSEDSPLSDKNLRLAVFYAIDQDGVRAFVNGGKNIPLATFGGTTYSDYNEDWLEGNFPYDLELAKEYLAQSNYPNGVTLQLNINEGNTPAEEEALAIQGYLEEIGITLSINTYPIAQYLPLESDSTAWDLGLSGFPNTSGYVVNSWAKYFDKNTIGRETTKNFIDDPELQAMMDTVLSVEGHTPENMDAVMEYMQENAVMKGLCVSYDNLVYNSDIISGVVLDQFNYICPGAFTYNVG
ncbi:MAG: ABC transporter substrate-binding protein [Oscillospiraceae bacterium]